MTTTEHAAPQDLPLQVEQVRTALAREFAGLIDLSDISHSPQMRDQVFLSRALAAKAIRLSSGCGAAEAAEAVIDGAGDLGIDAVGCLQGSPEIWVVQAKWSDRGRARVSSDAVLQVMRGLKHLVDLRYENFNGRFQRLADGVNAALSTPGCRIHLVFAILGDAGLNAETEALLSEVTELFGLSMDMLDVRFLGLADFHATARVGNAPEPITVTATLATGWHMVSMPHRSFTGAVAAEELADWYEAHGEQLFARNLRRSLGLTTVNVAIESSLLSNPEEFWYLNNGITVLCDRIDTAFFSRPVPGHPVRLTLTNASVVNGAQTLAAVHSAITRAPDTAAQALVTVRVICTGDADSEFAHRITRAANAQNRVQDQDFAALDHLQELIREDFARSLGKEYVYKRGELAPAPDAGCSMNEAAVALACAHPDTSLTARVLESSDYLWRRAPEGGYTQLFGNRPSALQIWRSVTLMRETGRVLSELAVALSGRDRGVADTGRLLMTHIISQLVGSDDIDESDGEWQARLESALGRVATALSLLIQQTELRYGQHAFLARTFRDTERCRELASAVLADLALGAEPSSPGLRMVRSPSRRPSTVALLVEHRRIEDGTQLLFRPVSPAEREALDEWLREDPLRYLATWTNDARKPLIWAVDGQQYSPSGLVARLWDAAGWEARPVVAVGPRYWHLPGAGSLADLAGELLMAAADEAGTDAD